jgi:hypothetical protein
VLPRQLAKGREKQPETTHKFPWGREDWPTKAIPLHLASSN